jgi:hypothetical protein
MHSPSHPVKRVIVVGNGPKEAGLSSLIDSADVVIRFNEPDASQRAGRKTDIMFVMNSGKTMEARLKNDAYWQSSYFQDSHLIVLPYHPSIIRDYHPRPNLLSRLKGRRADWTEQTSEKIAALGKTASVLPREFYLSTCDELGLARGQLHTVFPSAGILGIRYALQEFKSEQWQVGYCGFSFEGWKRHAWPNERAWVAQKVRQNKLLPITANPTSGL